MVGGAVGNVDGAGGAGAAGCFAHVGGLNCCGGWDLRKGVIKPDQNRSTKKNGEMVFLLNITEYI